MIEIIPTTPAHVAELAKNLREEDSCEIMKLGITASKALWRSYKNALFPKTALVNGRVAAIWGCGGTLMGVVGRPWLLTSPESEKVSSIRFASIYRREVWHMLEMFPKLESYVDAGYSKAVKLLEIVGFSLDEPQPFGKHGAMFRKYHLSSEDYADKA